MHYLSSLNLIFLSLLPKNNIAEMEGNYLNIAVQFKSLLTDLYGNRLSKLILFGSYARVEAREDSDIDFLVVLKDKEISVFKEI